MQQSVRNHPGLGTVHCLEHFPPDSDEALLFIPGNPGLVDFYRPFFSELLRLKPRLTILAHAHLGHTPGYPATEHSLSAQVQSAIEAFDELYHSTKLKPIIAAHSVGSWVALQVLKARPKQVAQVQLLFPTITHIVKTPNGRRLSWLFKSPMPWIVSWLSYLARPIPLSVLFRHWPASQVRVIQSLVHSPSAIYACLCMADEEMKTIRELDELLLTEHIDKLVFVFGANDDWVSEQQPAIVDAVGEARVVDVEAPHAFCIADIDSRAVAAVCASA
uniref:AB hydrolase-1 domain-containing protein n=1 Tax=Mycena chlorophos TaxID=658473 RepID=A0ABQ0LBC1_MYCCL|nr:predicted protein [Mycena chlorophos]